MSLNDPQWGRKGGNDGPPDLDEIARKFNQRLRALFGGKEQGDGGRGGRSTPPTGNAGAGVLMIGIGLLIAVWLASGFYIVQEGHRGLVLRLGKYNETTQPGPRWHIPYPFEAVEIVNISQVRSVEVGYRGGPKNKKPEEALMITEDENIVDVQFAIQYTLRSPEDYKFTNRDPDEAVGQAAESAIREVVGKSKMDFVLTEGRSEVADRAGKLMQQILDRYRTGIQISKVTMQQAQPPEQVQASFTDAINAGQDRERFRNEGQAYANDVVPRARGAASRLIEEANGYRQRVIASAEGDAERFKQIFTEYEKAPQVTRERLYLEAMQQVLASTSKVMIDQKSGQGNLLYLPLDKLMAQSAGASTDASASKSAGSEPIQAPPATPSTSREREAFRNRERP